MQLACISVDGHVLPLHADTQHGRNRDPTSAPVTPRSDKLIPINIISGPLGVGKTTAINHLLAHRPKDEQWAVLINEYGMVGLDAALLNDAAHPSGVFVREVAGGCICCSASFMFDVSLVLLLQRRPDRLLIEPTGLATLSGILDTLGRSGIREAVDVRSVICLLDPARLAKDVSRDEVKDQIEAADILLANRLDLAYVDQLTAFDEWARSVFPSKRYVGKIELGQIPLPLLDLVTARTSPPSRALADEQPRHLHDHGPAASDSTADPSQALRCDSLRPMLRRDHHSPAASTVGWVCWNGLVFDAARIARWLRALSIQPQTRRVKAVLRTTDGWKSFNLADGAEEVRTSGYRRDSRVELVLEGCDSPPASLALEESLRECLV